MKNRTALLIIVLGFVIRLFSCQYTYIINPDGVWYIHQARAIYFGMWDSILTCPVDYLSNYSIFIAGAYAIFGDWVVAAKSVSLLFGTMTLVPLYFLLKRFFDDRITLLTTLIFALIPVFVAISADIVRDSVYWFFSLLGLCLFVSQAKKRNYLYLILSSLSFLMATWARVEAILFILVSFLYILFVRQDRKIKKISFFAMPVVLFLLFCFSGLMIFNTNLNDFYRPHEIATKFSAPMSEYKDIRENLVELMNQPLDDNLPAFLHKARHLVWLNALGTLFKYAITAYFYPFFFIFIIGLGGIGARIKSENHVLYLAFIAISALILLYMHILQTWTMFNRFFAIFILPSFIFIGFGLEKIIHFFTSRFHIKESIALSILCLLILACSLPKNLKPREADKIVFKEIGQLIADREGNSQEIQIAASVHSHRWISFYANLDYKGTPCSQKNYDLGNIVGKNYGEFIRNLKKRGIKYFLWEEKHWPNRASNFVNSQKSKNFIRLGNWAHTDTGRMILFRVL